jgi:hypothetical protein
MGAASAPPTTYRRGNALHSLSSIESWSVASRHTRNVWRVGELPAVTPPAHHPTGPVRKDAGQSTERVVAALDRSRSSMRADSARPTTPVTVISTRPSSNPAWIWLRCVPSGRVKARRNSP